MSHADDWTSDEPREARILILGGYGNTGRRICQGLAARKDVQIAIGGPRIERARSLAAELSGQSAHPAEVLHFDARRSCAMPSEFDLVINAASQAVLAPAVVRAAISIGADAMDTTLSSPAKWSGLRALRPVIEASQRCVVTDAGLHPGVPGALVRWVAADGLDLRSAHVGGAFALDWRALQFSESVVEEFAVELASMDPSALVAGNWRRSYALRRNIDFGPPTGQQTCTPMMIEEVRELPTSMLQLRDTGFYVAGFGWAVDYLALPVCMFLARGGPSMRRAAGRALLAALRIMASAATHAVLVLDAEGVKVNGASESVRARVAHRSAYDLTAACVVATVEQWIAGRRPTGLWTQAAYVEPARFFERLGTLGAEVSRSSSAAPVTG